MTLLRHSLTALLVCLLPAFALAEQRPPVVKIAKGGTKLEYVSDAAGNRVPDFSAAGYGGGGVALPTVPARVLVEPVAGDDGLRIQTAIDTVAGFAPNEQGSRGAVQLAAGRH